MCHILWYIKYQFTHKKIKAFHCGKQFNFYNLIEWSSNQVPLKQFPQKSFEERETSLFHFAIKNLLSNTQILQQWTIEWNAQWKLILLSLFFSSKKQQTFQRKLIKIVIRFQSRFWNETDNRFYYNRLYFESHI